MSLEDLEADPRRPASSISPPYIIAVLAVLVLTAGLLLSGGSPRDSAAGASPAQSASPSTSSSPTIPATASPPAALRTPVVLARVALPNVGFQTPVSGQVAITDGAIWTNGDWSSLVQVDLATNEIASDVPLQSAQLAAGDGSLWAVGPVGGAPSALTVTLSRIDLQTGVPRMVGDYAPEAGVVVGLGSVWLTSGGALRIDPANGDVVARLPDTTRLTVACGALWDIGFQISETDERWPLSQVDPDTGAVVDQLELPVTVDSGLAEMDGLCWLTDGSTLIGIEPGHGIVATTQVAGGHLVFVGETLWQRYDSGQVQRIDPMTGDPIGPAWQLPSEDVRVRVSKVGADWRLLSAGGSLWLLNADHLVRYDIDVPAAVTPSPGPTPAPNPASIADLGQVTFRLDLTAAPDDGMPIRLIVYPDTDYRMSESWLTLCGPEGPACDPAGSPFERRLQGFDVGTALVYQFERVLPSGDAQVFAEGHVLVGADTLVEATY